MNNQQQEIGGHLNMLNDELLIHDLVKVNIIKSDGSYNTRAGMSLSQNPAHRDLWEKIKYHTNFLNEDVPIAQRIHAIVNGIGEPIICPTCKTNSPKFVSFKQGYNKIFNCGLKRYVLTNG